MSFHPPRKQSLSRRIGQAWIDLPAPVRMGILLIALVLIASFGGCVSTAPKAAAIPPERAAQCEAAGGCAYISKAEMIALMQQAYQIGAEQAAQEAAEGLDSHGCKRGMI